MDRSIMTQVIVYEDAKKEFSEKTENSVIELTHFKNEKYNKEFTKLLEKYYKKTKYSFEIINGQLYGGI
ncbi:MAG: hypothetical protein ACI389_05935 [Methanobrevibacter sp.]|uniref:hypothetical protein n=1 Tax=Methanobrevibacter sp. TaxID=66852 RepID=UPI003F068947